MGRGGPRRAYDLRAGRLTERRRRVASDQDFVEYVVDQMDPACEVSHKKMFGEYGLYSGGKLFALVCDNRLFMKPTEGGRAHIGRVVEAPPYPDAKPSFLIGDQLEDREWLSELVRITVRELPAAKPKKKAGSATRRGK